MRFKRILGLAVLLFTTPNFYYSDVIAQSDTTLELAGLQAPVEVIFDTKGVPHIYAQNIHDLFLAQGYVEASQRWWQMEWWRHLSAGRAAEIGGEALVESDIFFRSLDFDRAAALDLEGSSDLALDVLNAYAEGVNAYLKDKTPEEAAIEYHYLKEAGIELKLEQWTVQDMARWWKVMASNLSQNFEVELARAALIAEIGPLAELIIPPYPYGEHPVITEPGAVSYQVIQTSANLNFESVEIPSNVDYSRVGMELIADLDHVVTPFGRGQGIGSNGWVVSGKLTDTGLPYLANDPHLSIQMPSIWFEIGLHCTEVNEACPYDVVGVSMAGTPGITIGHNQRIAWGFTNTGADVQDLYILTLNPDNPRQYRYNNEWVDFEISHETIEVANGESVEIETKYSVWGPVISEAVGVQDQVLALHWTALEANTVIDAFIELNRAQDWDEFRAALRLFNVPAQNAVYADVDGNIGYQMPGSIPLRADGHTGKVPVDGSSDANRWQGYIPFDELPSVFNPDAGYIITANNAIVGPDYPYPLIDVYSYGWRALRLEIMIQNDSDGVITQEDMQAMQTDNYNLKADFLLPVLHTLETDDATLQQAIAWLGEWNRQNDADSPQAALFEMFWVELLKISLVDELGSAPAGGQDLEWYLMKQLVASANHPVWDNQMTADVTEKRDDILPQALLAAWGRMVAEYNNDPMQWAWGNLHIAIFRARPLGTLDDETLNTIFNVQIQVGGGSSILNATEWNSNRPFEVGSVPSMRQVLNLADWDASLRINSMGQSGNPDNPHYKDQVELWANLAYLPDWFTRDSVEVNTEATWQLIPVE